MNKKRSYSKKLYIILSVIVFSLAVTFIDAVVRPPYFSKIPIKVIFFLALPMLFFVIWREEWDGFRKLFRFRKNGLWVAFLLGIAVFGVILGGYFLLRGVIDFSSVTSSLGKNMGITAKNFLWVALYISIMNSFLEEFFFRGFCFFSLRPLGLPFAYAASALLFSAYHVAFMDGWLSPVIFALSLLGMAIGGAIFAFLNHKTESLLPSYFVHMASNLATNLIGIIMFYS